MSWNPGSFYAGMQLNVARSEVRTYLEALFNGHLCGIYSLEIVVCE